MSDVVYTGLDTGKDPPRSISTAGALERALWDIPGVKDVKIMRGARGDTPSSWRGAAVFVRVLLGTHRK